MTEHLFDEMKRYVRFGPEDEQCLLDLGPVLAPHLVEIVDDFYARITEHPDALAVIRGGPEQIERLKTTLHAWLQRCFEGPWDEAYFDARARIGHRHVEIGLPQHYNFTAMNIIRQHLTRLVAVAPGTTALRLARSLAVQRLMDLELAIVLHTYRESYVSQLKRNERLAAFGQLTSTIGHELRNPLAVVESSAYLLRRRVGGDPAAVRHVDKIQKQVVRSNRIIATLLDIVRDRPPSRVKVSPRELAARAATWVRDERHFEVQLDVPEGLDDVCVDAGQIDQVLGNLLTNAVDAAGPEGRVILSGRLVGGFLEFVVADSGSGIDPSVRERLFEPLVTTKGSGVGLGLALCKKLAEAHGGEVHLSKEPELSGAAFVVRLPRRPEA